MKVYVTRVSGRNTVDGVFATLAALIRSLADSGAVSKHFAEETAAQFTNHSMVTIETRGYAPYNLIIQEMELIED
jgi:hypothetical protein